MRLKFELILTILFIQTNCQNIVVNRTKIFVDSIININKSEKTTEDTSETTVTESSETTTTEISQENVTSNSDDDLESRASNIEEIKHVLPSAEKNSSKPPTPDKANTESSETETTTTEYSETENPQNSETESPKNKGSENSTSVKKDLSSLLKSFNKAVNTTIETIQKTSVFNPIKRKRRDNCNFKGPSCTKEGTFRFKHSCKKYYQCYFHTTCKKLVPKVYTCPKCLKFNAQKNICDLAENVPECSNLNTSIKTACTGPGTFFVPDDCHKYYECTKNGTFFNLTIKTCPPSTIFSRKDLKCIKGQKCIQSRPDCKSADSYTADGFDCTKFYYCVSKNFSVPLYCPSSYVFEKKVCENWESVKHKWNNLDSPKNKND